NYAAGLWEISSGGGTPKELTKPNAADGELGHFWPQVLPDGKSVLFTTYRSPVDTSRLEIYSLTAGTRTVVVDGGFFGRYVSSGHLVFARSGTLSAVPFDLGAQRVTGQPTPVLSDIAITASNGLAHFSVSNAGTLSYLQQSVMTPPNRLAWLDRSGRDTPIITERRRFNFPRLSPDGKRLAISISNQQDDDV